MFFHPKVEEEDRLATMAEADEEYVRTVGADRTDEAWIHSDRDVWYRNPFYRGPAVPHPEMDIFEDEDDDIPMM